MNVTTIRIFDDSRMHFAGLTGKTACGITPPPGNFEVVVSGADPLRVLSGVCSACIAAMQQPSATCTSTFVPSEEALSRPEKWAMEHTEWTRRTFGERPAESGSAAPTSKDITDLAKKVREAMVLPGNGRTFESLTIGQAKSLSIIAASLALKAMDRKRSEAETYNDTLQKCNADYRDRLLAATDRANQAEAAADSYKRSIGDLQKINAEAQNRLAQTEEALAWYQRAADEVFQDGQGGEPILPGFLSAGDNKSDGIVKLAKAYDALMVERAGLQARLRAQEDPRDAQVLTEATTRFLAIFGDPKPTLGTLQDRVGMGFREVLGILREAAVAKPAEDPYKVMSDHVAVELECEKQAIESRIFAVLSNRPRYAMGTADLNDAVRTERQTRAQILDAIARMMERGVIDCDMRTAETVLTPLGINAVRVITQARPEVLTPEAKPDPEALAAAAFQDRVKAQRTRILAAADNQPRSHNDLWKRAGSPQNDDSTAFDTALLRLAEEGKLVVTADTNPSRSKLYRLP